MYVYNSNLLRFSSSNKIILLAETEYAEELLDLSHT